MTLGANAASRNAILSCLYIRGRRAHRCLPLIALSFLGLCLAACRAADFAPEAQYLSAKADYRRTLSARQRVNIVEDAATRAADDSARLDLERRLRPIIGVVRVAGFSGSGKSNLATLLEGYEDSRLMNGLLFEASDSVTRLLVTTPRLMIESLGATVSSEAANQRAMAALADPLVYTSAFETDAAVSRYADIPIGDAKRTGLAVAMLVARAQDIGPREANEVVIGAIRGGRIFIVDTRARVVIPPMPECVALWERGRNDDADVAFHRCYAGHAPRDSAFSQLIAQVRALVAALPPQ